MMMNGLIIMHHSRSSALLLLWFSLVALCDPLPSSGRGLSSSNDGPGSIHHNSEVAGRTHPSGSDYHPKNSTHSRNELGPATTASKFHPSLLQLPNVTKSKVSATNSNPTRQSSLPSSPSFSASNNSSRTLFNRDAAAILAVNGPATSNTRNGDKKKLEKGKPSSLVPSKLNPGWLEKIPAHHLHKLSLKLDRDYTPREIADYIWRTGDEKGFSQAVAEMVQDGELMMESKDDVIQFLEIVQHKLDKWRRKEPVT